MNSNKENKKIIELLLNNAQKAFKNGEIPVSALIVQNNKIIASAYNKKEKMKDITAHAEVLAIKKAAKKLKRWNLNDCILYVSLKPCQMCYEIIKQSRIQKVIYYLEKLDYKKDYQKTNCVYQNDLYFSNTYQQLLSNFFENKR